MNIPTKEALEEFIKRGVPEVAELLIKQHNLKYKVDGNQVIDYSEGTESWLRKFITVNQKMLNLKNDVRKLANVDDPVLIVGPTGTGKELIAHALHGDRTGKFLGVNCAGLPSELIESELFGHTAAAFTGASVAKKGIMAETEDGTLFLDEIGDFPLAVQAKLLRAIQEKVVRRVGGTREEAINCRIVCATHRNLKDMVAKDQFRIDLYARISTFELETIALSERIDDIVPIIQSLQGGDKFIKLLQADKPVDLDLSLNVRSLIKYVRRYQVLGII